MQSHGAGGGQAGGEASGDGKNQGGGDGFGGGGGGNLLPDEPQVTPCGLPGSQSPQKQQSQSEQ